jgi:hypothetical protein
MFPRLVCFFLLLVGAVLPLAAELRDDGWHVHPGESIQATLDAAALSSNKVVKVFPGVYRPDKPRQALIWLNRRHEGIRLSAVGTVILTAANPDLANGSTQGAPAVVNHVIYVGDGISRQTVIQGFKLTGANHFVTTNDTERMEPDSKLPKGLFFYCDGGAIKIHGRSFPTLKNLEIADNFASPCAGGISIEHGGFGTMVFSNSVLIENCVFRNNRAQITGSALDVLPGSAAVVTNCLFVANASNCGINSISPNTPATEFTNCGAITVFPSSRVVVTRSTFTGNRNGIDDWGGKSEYIACLFAENKLGGGFYTSDRYDLSLDGGGAVRDCVFSGSATPQLGKTLPANTLFDAGSPGFDGKFTPSAANYLHVGYRARDIGPTNSPLDSERKEQK